MTFEEMIDGTMAEMQKYGANTTLGELIRIKIREKEEWAARSWADGLCIRGDLYAGIASHVIWGSLLQAAAERHPDWIYQQVGNSQAECVTPRKRAIIRTRKAVVAWFVLNHTDHAFALEDEAWNTVDA